MIRLSLTLASIALISSCGRNEKSNYSSNSDKDTTKKNTETALSINDFALVEPIKKFIYYMNEVDITTYDSISTQYFHEVIDYTDTSAISLDKRIQKLQILINGDSLSEFEKEISKDEIVELSTKLSEYDKSVTGYVFLHTFLNKGDTLSAIIITNADMSKGEAFPVNTVSNIEPSQYTDNVRQIEQ